MNMDYYQISAEELGQNAKVPLLKLGDSGEVFYELALEMVGEIEKNNAVGRRTVFICPVGPVGQYPIFVRLVNERRLSLKNCWFINMDEYLTDDEEWIDERSALSFHGFMNRTVYSKIDPELVMPENQRIFPDPHDPGHIAKVIDELGGVDIAFGGIGINGHLAFNEAQDELTADEFAALHTRVLTISRETRTSNAIGDLNGAIDAMPRKAVTIGMAGDFGREEDSAGRFPRLAPFGGAAGGLWRSERAFPGDAHSAASGRDDHCERERCEAAVLRGRGTLRALPSNSHKGTEFP